jgi:hypothetical protein
MIKFGEVLCGLLLAILMVPVFLVGFIVAMFDIGHYYRIRQM